MTTAIKERPILFNAEMVNAILDGSKTQTRRVIKPQPVHLADDFNGFEETLEPHRLYYLGKRLVYSDHYKVVKGPKVEHVLDLCPYGKPGERLWVREAFKIVSWHEGEPIGLRYRDGEQREEDYDDSRDFPAYEDWYGRVCQQSAEDLEKLGFEPDDCGVIRIPKGEPVPTRWRPSIHMPRWVSRILLEITDVRVERVQDMSSGDAMAEGIGHTKYWTPKELEGRPFEEKWWDDHHFFTHYPQEIAFPRLWDSINLKRGYGWESNPWVWVIEFKVVE